MSASTSSKGRGKPTRRPPDRYHHGDLRRALVEAALQLVAEHGPRGFTLREIARVLGVTHTAPYRHFADKQELMRAVAVEGLMGLSAATQRELEGVDTPVAALRALGLAYIRYAVDHPAHFKVMFSREFADGAGMLEDAKRQTLGVLIETIAACQASGDFPPGAPERMAIVAWAHVHGLATLLVDGSLPHHDLVGSDDLPQMAEDAVATVLTALRAGVTTRAMSTEVATRGTAPEAAPPPRRSRR